MVIMQKNKRVTSVIFDYPTLFIQVKLLAISKGSTLARTIEHLLKLGLTVENEVNNLKKLGFTDEECKNAFDTIVKGIAIKAYTKRLQQESERRPEK